MKAAIVGSRTFNDYTMLLEFIYQTCVDNHYEITEVISGGAKGADSLGKLFADNYNLKSTIFVPNWETYGKKAGFMRNHDIIKNCDICFCFWDGESHGTKHDIELCKQYNKPCYICKFIS